MYIETERLIIRPFQADDLDEYYELIFSSPDVMRYLDDGKVRTREQTERSINRFIDYGREHGFSICAVIDKKLRRLVGHCGLITLLKEPLTIEVAYAFGKPYWGQGFATEAARACLRYGFETAHLGRIVAVAYPDNKPSQRVMQKIGMQHKGESFAYHNLHLILYEQTRDAYQPDDSFYVAHL